MLIRSSQIFLDAALCSAQGYLGALLVNGTKTYKCASSFNVALALGSIAIIEKLVYLASKRFIPGPTILLGPIPLGTKNIVSYGLATYLTLRTMQLARLISRVPSVITALGLASTIALAVGGLKAVLQSTPKTLEERLKEHTLSTKYANKVFSIKGETKTYQVRIICNPEQKEVTFRPGGMGTVSSTDPYLIGANENLPEELSQMIKAFFDGKACTTLSMVINSTSPLDYMASPSIE